MVAAIQVTVKAHEKAAGQGPGLAFIVLDIFNFQSYFFHYLPFYRFFQSFSDLRKACDQCIASCCATGIFRHEKPVSVSHSYDHRRRDLGVLGVFTVRAVHHPFPGVRHQRVAAFPAEFPGFIPVMELIAGDQGKAVYLRSQVPENDNVFHSISGKCVQRFIPDKIIVFLVNGK